jgi:nicotinamidase-related amidase
MTGQTFCDLAPNRVAVLLIDFQNDFCSPELFSDKIPTNTLNTETAHRANEFARSASALGCHAIYTRQVLDLSKLTSRQQQWQHPDGLCAAGSWGAELFIDPIPGGHIVTKHRFDIWQSQEFLDLLDRLDVEGLVIGGVELQCCVLCAVLGAEERGFHYAVAQDIVSGQDPGRDTYNRAVREYLRITHGALEEADSLLHELAARTEERAPSTL